MNWKTIRAGLMVFLIIINLVLFWINRMEMDRLYSATDEDLRQILELYDQSGISVEAVLRREGYPRAPMILGEASYLTMELVERFLGQDYQVAYMDARQRRYTKGDQMIVLDPDRNRLEFSSSWQDLGGSLSRQLEQKMQDWLGSELHWVCTEIRTEEGASYWVYVQEQDGLYLYFNRVTVEITDDGRLELEIQYYEPQGYERQTREVRPLDELMYGAMQAISERGGANNTLKDIRYGYDRDSSGGAVYVLEFVLENGRTVRMNAYTNEVLN